MHHKAAFGSRFFPSSCQSSFLVRAHWFVRRKSTDFATERCQRTSSASRRATVSTQSTLSTVPAQLSTDSSATTTATRRTGLRSRRTFDNRLAERQIKSRRVCLLARFAKTSDVIITNDEHSTTQKRAGMFSLV